MVAKSIKWLNRSFTAQCWKCACRWVLHLSLRGWLFEVGIFELFIFFFKRNVPNFHKTRVKHWIGEFYECFFCATLTLLEPYSKPFNYSRPITSESLWVRSQGLTLRCAVCVRAQACGTQCRGRQGEAGRAEVVHVGRAHQPLRVRERKGKRCSNLEASQTSAADYEKSLFSIAIYIQKTREAPMSPWISSGN